MNKPRLRITTVMFNSEYPEELVKFWSSLLQVEAHPHNEKTEHIWLFPQEENGIKLGFQRVAKKHHSESEIHIDIAVDDLDHWEGEVLRLGGSVQARTKLDMGFEWRILQDPQGNAFCIFVPFGE
ncbi:MAG: VOC family protein [Actinomycetota bacterium]